MKLTVTFYMDNAAFEECGPRNEAARILSDTAKRLENGERTPFQLRDLNGNLVGALKITKE